MALYRLLLFVCALAVTSLAIPLPEDAPLEVAAIVVEDPSSLSEASPGGLLLRVKRQYRRGGFGGRQGGGGYRGGNRGGYPGGGFGGGYPGGGFGGGFPQGGFQTPSFSNSAANAQSQAFNAGNFGASHAGAGTQGFSAGPNGIQGSAGQSFSQNYRFPGLDIGVSGAQSFGVGPGGVTRGGSSAITVNGQPFNG